MSELIYGRRPVVEVLRAARRRIYRLWLEGKEIEKPDGNLQAIQNMASSAGVPCRNIDGGLFAKLAQKQAKTQGVALEVGEYPYVDTIDILALAGKRQEAPLLLILDHLQDPQNLGTLMRTAEAMGVHGVIIPKRRAARVTAAVCSASAGAVEHLLISQETNINRTIDELKRRNVWVAGLDSGPDIPLVKDSLFDGPLALTVGSEGAGLSRLTREKCDFLVRLPMYGKIESLNAAVAGSIALYVATRARTLANC
jgi:23S rRNA (guanosine2251-2'-O)-methyltransferase